MATTVVASGTLTGHTVNVDNTLSGSARTESAFFQLVTDLGALTGSDEVSLRIETKVLSGGTSRVVFHHKTPVGPQRKPILVSQVLPSNFEATFKLMQTAGTARDIPWKILSLGTPTAIDSGTQTATVTTEHSLGSEKTSTQTYCLIVDTGGLIAGASGNQEDNVLITAKYKVLSGGTQRVMYSWTAKGPQIMPIKVSQPCPSNIGVEFTLTQTHGSGGRDFPWKILGYE